MEIDNKYAAVIAKGLDLIIEGLDAGRFPYLRGNIAGTKLWVIEARNEIEKGIPPTTVKGVDTGKSNAIKSGTYGT